jgi:capsular exopolysaccharide synthesis family protein
MIEFALGNVPDISEGLAGRLVGELDPSRNFMHLTLTGSRPERTAAVLDAVAERLVQVASELRRDNLATMETILAKQRRAAEENLRKAQRDLETFRVQTATLPREPGLPINPGLQETNLPARSMYTNLMIEQMAIQADRDVVEQALALAADSGLAIVALEGVASRYSAELAGALSELTQKRAELEAVRNRYFDDHVLARRAREAVGDSEQRAIELARLLVDQLEAEDQRLERRIAAAAGELGEIPSRAIREDALERRVQSAQTSYDDLQARHDAILLAEANNIPDVQVYSWAALASRPINAKQSRRLIMVAFLASLALGVGLAVLFYNMDPRVKSPDELGRLGLRILGTVPHVNTGRPAETLRNADEVVESFRLIRLNVTHAHGTAGPIVLAITSPTGSEGKSFVASNLGLAFSHLGLRTLVIDADVRRGRVHRLLGGTRRPGLTDYLGGVASLEQVVKPTQHKALFRIASGTRRQGAPELLQSSAMVSLVADLRSSYDVLIIDTPPIGVGADALALAALAGNLVVVVRTGSTNRELTEAKLEFLFRMPVRVLGAVLNDVPARGVHGYYGSPYYSSYLPGYESKDEESASLSAD